MNKNISESTIPVIVTIIFTFFLQYSIEYFSQPKGVYEFSYITYKEDNIAIIQLENKSDDFQTDLIFLIDGNDINQLKIDSDTYLDYKLSMSKSDSTKSLLTINNQLPNTSVNITLKGLNRNTKIFFSNNSDKKYVLKNDLVDAQLNFFKSTLLTTLLFGLMYAIYFKYIMRVFKRNRKEQRSKNKILDKDIKKIKKSIIKRNESSMKQRLILMSKIRDYEKELNFWKSLMSTILLKDDLVSPKNLYKKITDELQTFGTRDLTYKELKMAEYIDIITKTDN